MIKVRVTRAGIAGASGLVALSSGVAACSSHPAEDTASTSESGLTTMDPGTGVLSLSWIYGSPSGYAFTAQNSVDEYVRVGETMTFQLTADVLWQKLYPDVGVPEDVSRLEKLSAKVTIVFVKAGAAIGSAAVETTGFSGSYAWDVVSSTTPFKVAPGSDGMRFEIAVADAADPTKSASFAQADFLEVPVLGGGLPNKTLLFDSFYATMRQRVLEGGRPVSGAALALAYSDWRAATLVDSASIDRTIGNATEHGRFGSFDAPIQGNIEYDISYGVALDDAWQPEVAFIADAASRLMPTPAYGRTAYEGSLHVPAGTKKLDFYFHVKAYVVADYTPWGSDVTWKKYNQGDRILVREKWDNLNGIVGSNYELATEGN